LREERRKRFILDMDLRAFSLVHLAFGPEAVILREKERINNISLLHPKVVW
jgi:hypothetical protein